MGWRTVFLGLSALFSLSFSAVSAGQVPAKAGTSPAAESAERVPVLILFARQPGPAEEALVRGLGGGVKYTYRLVPAIAATVPDAAVSALRANPNVRAVEPDIEVHIVDHATTEGDAELNNTWGVKHIGAGAIHNGGNKGAGVKVAVVDTGIAKDPAHPDLSHDPTCSKGFGYPNDKDGHGHGTHVAGTVAALDNGSGVVGVAPEVTICALKVLSDSGGGSYSDVVAALDYIAQYNQANSAAPIQVTNNSYGSSGDPGQTVKAAFDNLYAAGVLHAAAAGNSGNPPGNGDNCIYPARWDSLIATAATKQDDNRASFSSTCPELELAAPGYQIKSTVPGGGYESWSGTSMASPHVAGTAALVWTAYPDWSNGQVRSRLQATAKDLGAAGRDSRYGYGLVQANGAATSATLDTTAPTLSDVAAGNVTSNAAEITWTTNEAADSLVEYRKDTVATYTRAYDGSLVTSHKVSLTNLEAGTNYYYRVASADAAGNKAVSDDYPFTTGTASGDPNKLGVYDITWKSDKNHLTFTANVRRDSDGDAALTSADSPVGGASVQATLARDSNNNGVFFECGAGDECWPFSFSTDSNGNGSGKLLFAPSGTYRAEVTGLSGTYTWDSALDRKNPSDPITR